MPPPTRVIPDRAAQGAERWIALAFVLLFFGLLGWEVAREFHPGKAAALLLAAFQLPRILIHELGHALATWAMGWRVGRIEVGAGRPWLRFHLAGAPVVIRLYPVAGFVVPVPRTLSLCRPRFALIALAGPAADLASAIPAWLWAGGWDGLFTPTDDWGRIALQAWALSAAISAVSNLLPLPWANALDGEQPSDGWQALRAWWCPIEEYDDRRAIPWLNEAEPAESLSRWDLAAAAYTRGLQRLPDHPLLQRSLAHALLEAGELDEADALLARLLASPTTTLRPSHNTAPSPPAASRNHRLVALHLAMRLRLRRGSDEDLAQVLALSEQALSLSPGNPLIQTARAAALVELHRLHEAMPLLHEAMEALAEPEDRQRCALYLALAELRRGNRPRAVDRLHALRAQGVRGALIDRIEAELRR